jgi:hypothetical protein
MKIVYDDLFEFSEVAIRCNDTARKGKCSYCPFFDRCKIDEPENRHVQCGELDHPTEKGGATDTNVGGKTEKGGEKG